MNTQKPDPLAHNIWRIVLPVSLVINGLMFGLLLSGALKPETRIIQTPQAIHGPTNTRPQTRKTLSEDPRKFLRALPIERRKQVMIAAYKNLDYQTGERPGQLFRQLRRAERRSLKLLKAEDFDLKAIEQSLAKTREIKHKLAISGDAMIIEVLSQLSEQERKDAVQALKNRQKNYKKNRRQPNRQ